MGILHWAQIAILVISYIFCAVIIGYVIKYRKGFFQFLKKYFSFSSMEAGVAKLSPRRKKINLIIYSTILLALLAWTIFGFYAVILQPKYGGSYLSGLAFLLNLFFVGVSIRRLILTRRFEPRELFIIFIALNIANLASGAIGIASILLNKAALAALFTGLALAGLLFGKIGGWIWATVLLPFLKDLPKYFLGRYFGKWLDGRGKRKEAQTAPPEPAATMAPIKGASDSATPQHITSSKDDEANASREQDRAYERQLL